MNSAHTQDWVTKHHLRMPSGYNKQMTNPDPTHLGPA